MIRGICDHPDRIAARAFIALRSDCPCCTFYRGVAFGVLAGLLFAGVTAAIAIAALGNLFKTGG